MGAFCIPHQDRFASMGMDQTAQTRTTPTQHFPPLQAHFQIN
jgi:hypothetical protein